MQFILSQNTAEADGKVTVFTLHCFVARTFYI